MEIKNCKYNKHGTIDMEINHPIHGWIPFTASPHDSEPHGRRIYQEMIESGNILPFINEMVTNEEENI